MIQSAGETSRMRFQSLPFNSCMARRVQQSLLLILAFAAAKALHSQAASQNDPGDPLVALNGNAAGKISNSLISASWQSADGRHLSSLKILQTQSPDQALILDGPFSIEFKGIGVLRASDLDLAGPPAVEHLVPNPDACCKESN